MFSGVVRKIAVVVRSLYVYRPFHQERARPLEPKVRSRCNHLGCGMQHLQTLMGDSPHAWDIPMACFCQQSPCIWPFSFTCTASSSLSAVLTTLGPSVESVPSMRPHCADLQTCTGPIDRLQDYQGPVSFFWWWLLHWIYVNRPCACS